MGQQNWKKRKQNRGGRPSKINADVLKKLEDAFMNGFSDEMACFYAEISHQTLYNYQHKHPEYVERKELLKKNPDIIAQRQLIKGLNSDQGARWWAEHKMAEFMPKSKVEHTGKVMHEMLPPSPEVLEAVKVYETMREKQIRAEARVLLKD